MLMPMLRSQMAACYRLKFFLENNKPYTLIDIPLYEKNENKFFQFSKKIFISQMDPISIKWITSKLTSWFSLKDKNIYLVCKIYHGLYSC